MSKNEIASLFPNINMLVSKEFDRLEHIAQTKDLVADDYATLYFLLGHDTLEKACNIIDNECVKLIEASKTKRKYFQVDGSRSNQLPYVVFLDSNFCSCEAFLRSTSELKTTIPMKKDNMRISMCKHQIAARLASITNKYQTLTLPEQKFAARICSDIFE